MSHRGKSTDRRLSDPASSANGVIAADRRPVKATHETTKQILDRFPTRRAYEAGRSWGGTGAGVIRWPAQ